MSLKQTLGTYPPRVACSRTRVGVPRRNMKPLRYLIERVQMRQARTLWIDSQRNPRLRVNRLAKRKVGIWLVFMTFFRWASISVFISGSIIHFSRCLNKPNSCFNSFIRRKLCRIVNVLWDFFLQNVLKFSAWQVLKNMLFILSIISALWLTGYWMYQIKVK